MDDKTKSLIEKLESEHHLELGEYEYLIAHRDQQAMDFAAERADCVRREIYGTDVYVRGLIEFSNYCKNDCLYCGIRRDNKNASRYRLTEEQILDCCAEGYELGFRTFVLQSGEDSYYTDEILCDLIGKIKKSFPDCALTLSIGEKSRESYQAYFDAGADRYLLRHETASPAHYAKLHPGSMSFLNRIQCLYDLHEIGYQVGCGFMVGSPYQTPRTLAEDMMFIERFRPEMCGIGPFIPHKDTPFRNEPAGTLEETLYLLSLLRLLQPNLLLPATTALGTINPLGREMGAKAGANVVMPNLSPTNVRKKYMLYDNKICTGDESAQCRHCLDLRMESVGYQVVISRGDIIRK